MLESVHEEMTREVLGTSFSPRALETVIRANLGQDSFKGLLGHDEYHFDNNAFDGSYRYINEQRGLVLASLLVPGLLPAWNAFGRLIHTVQDFYAHTNYVALWLGQHNGAPPPPPAIDPLQKDLIDSPGLFSGRVYLPFDALYLVPALRSFSLACLPRDSHGWMNLDSQAQGPRFEYARAAAVKRTRHEFEILQKLLTPEMFARFTDL
jgi:hypothetical protein